MVSLKLGLIILNPVRGSRAPFFKKEIMRNRKTHVTLPLKIPQNILDIFIEYREWRKDYTKFPKNHKDAMLKRLDKIAPKWHLYTGWESMAGSFFIHTKVGIMVYVHINEDKPLTIQQCTDKDSNVWNGEYPQTERIGNFVYHWDGYKPLIIPEE